MAQFSVEIMRPPGSVLAEKQQPDGPAIGSGCEYKLQLEAVSLEFPAGCVVAAPLRAPLDYALLRDQARACADAISSAQSSRRSLSP